MQNIADIKNRIKSVKETRQITKAMQLISVAKMRRANENYQRNLAYSTRVRGILKDILNHTDGEISHPYLKHRDTSRTAFVVVASDNGLTGDYNHRILNFAKSRISEVKEAAVFIIGQMANEFFTRIGDTPDMQFLYCAQNPTLNDARLITADLVELYDNNHIDEVRIIYTKMEGNHNVAADLRLLPILKEDFADAAEVAEGQYTAIMEFEPSVKEVFDILVPQYIVGLTYTALIQAVRCEHNERVETMSNATGNADKMALDLELKYHRARQETITTELAELSSAQNTRR